MVNKLTQKMQGQIRVYHLLIALFFSIGTFVTTHTAKAHSVAVYIEVSGTQVRFHALTWHAFRGNSGSMSVNGVWYRFTSSARGPVPSTFRLVASCGGYNSYNNGSYTYQSTDWLSGINLCSNLAFNMTSYYLEEPACYLGGSVDVTTPVILQPVTVSPGTTFCAGGFSMSLVASGINLTYQWQSNSGSGWSNISGATGSTYSGTGTTSMTGWRYRCVVTSSGSCGTRTATSNEVQITVNNGTSITSQPVSSQTACSGTSLNLSVGASGSNLRYQWQVSSDNSIFSNIPGANAATLPFTAGNTIYTNGMYLRCVVTGNCGSVSSSSSRLFVNATTAVTSNPSSVTSCEDLTTSFSVSAAGTNLTYQWQVSRNNGTSYSNIANGAIANLVTYSGATSSSLSLSALKPGLSGALYRCVVSGSCAPATATSSAATLTVNQGPAITAQPNSSVSACSSTNASFVVDASGTSLGFQWEVNTGSPNTWVPIGAGGAYSIINTSTRSTLTIATSTTFNNYQYRCVVSSTSGCGSSRTSSIGTLTVLTPATISAQPSNLSPSVCEAGTLSMTFGASGSNLTYKWQVNTGSGFSDITTGANYRNFNTNTLTILGAPAGFNTYQYRGVAMGTCGTQNTNAITLTVNRNPAVTAQPSNTASCITVNTATFTVAGIGAGLTYQWESSPTGATYSTISNGSDYAGVTTNTLTVTPSAGLDQYRYRVKLSGICGNPVYSDAKILTVNSLPNITAQPLSNTSVCAFANVTLSLTNTGLYNTFQWQQSTNGGSSWTNLSNTTTNSQDISFTGVTTNSMVLGRVPASYTGRLYRCLITANQASCGSVAPTASGTVTLTVNTKPAITLQPVNANNNTFLQNSQFSSSTTTTYVYRTTATGSFANPSANFQWKVSTNGGVSWSDVTTNSDITYSVSTPTASPTVSTMQAAFNNSSTAFRERTKYIYRCLIVGICDNVTTNAVKVNIPPKLNR